MPTIETYILLIIHGICLTVKSFIFFKLFNLAKNSRNTTLWIILSVVLFGSIFSDIAWVIVYLRSTFIDSIRFSTITLFSRLAWTMYIVQYQALTLFIESLENKKIKIKSHNLAFGTFGLLIIFYFLYHLILGSPPDAPYEKLIINATNFHIFIIFIPTIVVFIQMLKAKTTPRILTEQILSYK